jgi:prephenate dehydratase
VAILALGEEVDEPKTHSMLLSRFYMHDLTKITSRKSTTKVITFYFRIPTFAEYKQTENLLETDLVQKIFTKP